jgi:hypothetical protein
MDYYQSVVTEYLRADRALFVNPECVIQVGPRNTPGKGMYSICDAVVADFRSKTIFVCEISYSFKLPALINRLRLWGEKWTEVAFALERDSCLPNDWLSRLRPWLFVPQQSLDVLLAGLSKMGSASPVSTPRITTLEMAQPWNYCESHRKGEIDCCERHRKNKDPKIPPAMAI